MWGHLQKGSLPVRTTTTGDIHIDITRGAYLHCVLSFGLWISAKWTWNGPGPKTRTNRLFHPRFPKAAP